jgi:hypothetical protein
MNSIFVCITRLTSLILFFAVLALNAAAQTAIEHERDAVQSSTDKLLYLMIFIALAGLGGAYYFWKKSKAGIEQPQYNYKNRYKDYYSNGSYEFGDVDAEKELEWLRKAKKTTSKNGAASQPESGKRGRSAVSEDTSPDTKLFQDKMKKLQYAQLPINSFNMLAPARDFEPLPISNDPALLSAIEQTQEEFEDDEAIRELAVRILAAFRTRNSVDALHQVALYDLSSNLRSKAVAILTDFDHETVFEAILLACADPTREVRAAAARGLFRLNFDRAGAWTRIIETGDEFRMSHAARAAVESGIVLKSFDRLVHEDMKISYEAFCLVAVLIKAGEDAEIFDAIRGHKDERVKFALLHVIKAIKDERSVDGLTNLYKEGNCPPDVSDRVRDAVKSFEHAVA